MKKQIKVRYCKYGLANFYGDCIEINKNLKYHKRLRDLIVRHELGHIVGFDLKYETLDSLKLLSNPYHIKLLLSFFIKTPSTWIDVLPIQYKNKQIIYDLNLLILYGFTIILIFLIKIIF